MERTCTEISYGDLAKRLHTESLYRDLAKRPPFKILRRDLEQRFLAKSSLPEILPRLSRRELEPVVILYRDLAKRSYRELEERSYLEISCRDLAWRSLANTLYRDVV